MHRTDTMASMDIVLHIILIALCFLKYAEFKSEVASVRFSEGFYTSDMIANNRYDGKSCTIDKLDNKSWKECGDKGYIMNCGQLDLQEVPHTYPALNGSKPHLTPPLCLLNLSHNHFVTLMNKSFMNAVNMNSTDVLWLYLYYCQIKYIESNAFMHLSKLIYLNLTGNHLTWPDGFGVGVFRPLISLTDINFYGNNITTFEGLGRELQYMKQLKGLFIDLCENCTFGEGFENLTHLTNLSLSQITGIHSCYAPIIYNDTFKYVSKVQHLFIGSCHIHTIQADAFSPLKELEKLDMSYNEDLHFEGMNTALYGLRNSTTLKILNVNRIHEMYGLGVMLKLSDMENLKTLQALEVLHMDLNKIEVLEEDVPRLFPKTMTNLTLSGNRLTYGKYLWHLNDIKGVVHIDISRQHLGYDPFFFEHFEGSANLQLAHAGSISVTTPVTETFNCTSQGVLFLPENLESLQWSKSFIWLKMDAGPNIRYCLSVCGAKNLKQLDLSFNLISTWNLIILGLENVTDLDLSMNNCDTVIEDFFQQFKGLKRLNVSRNLLGSAFNNIESSKQPYLFKGLTELEEIDLSSNKITHFHKDMFKNLSSIKRLYFGNNLLTNWNTSLEKNRCLEELSLTNNKLNVLEEATTTYLDSLTTEPCYSSVVVDLSENPLDCACSHLYFLRWARDTPIHVKMSNESDCSVQGKRYPLRSPADLQDIINILEGDVCKDRTWVTWVASSLSVVCTGFLSAVSCFLVYKNRWKLRYLYHTRHRRHILEGYDRLFQYDVFISYSKSLGSFMKHSAVPMLEGIHHLVTWVYDKDSVPGISMAENITHAINNSKKVVLLLNREFLKDSWCEYETNMAYVESISTKRKMIILVTMEQIQMEELPLYLRRLLMTERSVEYPEHGQDESTFWMNLVEEIRA